MIEGVDCSEWQGDSWQIPDVKFAFVRLAEWRPDRGGFRFDRQARRRFAELDARGVPAGGYVRFDPTRQEPDYAARMFVALCEEFDCYDEGRLFAALDVEPTGDKVLDATVNWPRWTREVIAGIQERAPDPRHLLYASGSYLQPTGLLGGVRDLDPMTVSFWVGHTRQYAPTPFRTGTDEQWAGNTPFDFAGRTAIHQFAHEPHDRDCLMPGWTLEEVTY